MKTDRRSFLQVSLSGLAAIAAVPLLSGLEGCQELATRAQAGPVTALPSEKLTDRLSVISSAPGNVLVLTSSDGLLLVDSGSQAMARSVQAAVGVAPVRTLINTHYHEDQTGGNALFGVAGAAIHAHAITREWLATAYYVPEDNRWIKALPPIARPTVTFGEQATMKAGAESIECGYLLEAHTRGDIYVFFRGLERARGRLCRLAAARSVARLVRGRLDRWAGGCDGRAGEARQ